MRATFVHCYVVRTDHLLIHLAPRRARIPDLQVHQKRPDVGGPDEANETNETGQTSEMRQEEIYRRVRRYRLPAMVEISALK